MDNSLRRPIVAQTLKPTICDKHTNAPHAPTPSHEEPQPVVCCDSAMMDFFSAQPNPFVCNRVGQTLIDKHHHQPDTQECHAPPPTNVIPYTHREKRGE